MGRKKTLEDTDEKEVAKSVTDIEALKDNIDLAVYNFIERYIPMPAFTLDCEVMDQGQLRDAMGLRVTDVGDPWPAAEQQLIAAGFRWQMMGSQRVMFLREKDDYVPDDGWEEAVPIDS